MHSSETERRDLEPAEWVARYGDYLFAYAVGRLRNQESAEEAVQETLLAALRHRDQYSGAGAERAWLLGILKRKIVDVVRARQREQPIDAELEGSDITTLLFDQRGHWKTDPRTFGRPPEEALERVEWMAELQGCLDQLPTRQADVFTLREIDARSSKEICKDLEITPSNLWVLLHRARLALANCLKSRWQGADR